MRIVFYSTNSNKYSPKKMSFTMIPSIQNQWRDLRAMFLEHEFVVVMQKSEMFLYNDEFSRTKSDIKYVFVDDNDGSAEKIAALIKNEKPDIAISVSYWSQPFDWMNIKDALIADILRDFGIKTICHSAKTAAICFDKWQTQQFLENNAFIVPKTVYVHHEMFYAERKSNVVEQNVYRDYVFSQIKCLKFPVVIKDTFSLSSFGTDVVKTFQQAKDVLFSKKNNGDRIVQEFIVGNSFGLEIYGAYKNYFITPPMINSVNQFGLTSPKQNVKLGPVIAKNGEQERLSQKFCLLSLQKEMQRLANLLEFNGIAQIDLVFSNNKWYIIEINSRISGMTQTMACSMEMSLYQLILFASGILAKNSDAKNCFPKKYVMNLKFPLLDENVIAKMASYDFVHAINKIENHEAKQLREVGYTEMIFGGTESLEEIMAQLEMLKKLFPDKMEKIFYDNAQKLYETIK